MGPLRGISVIFRHPRLPTSSVPGVEHLLCRVSNIFRPLLRSLQLGRKVENKYKFNILAGLLVRMSSVIKVKLLLMEFLSALFNVG